MPGVYRRELYNEGTDSALNQLEDWNAAHDQTRPRRRLLDNLLEDERPFHETIMPRPAFDPHNPMPRQVLPAPKPPEKKPLKSILVR